MTREKAKTFLLQFNTDKRLNPSEHEAIRVAIKSLEQEPVLDKIRAEIKTKYDSIPWRNNDYDDGWVEALEWVFDDVIDKYKAESEDT